MGYAPGGETPDTTVIPYWLCSECVVGLNSILLDPSNCVFSVFPLDCFAVINLACEQAPGEPKRNEGACRHSIDTTVL